MNNLYSMTRRAAFAAVMIALALTLSVSTARAGTTDQVKREVLPNGLTVLTREIHTSPVVNIAVWYKVGSRNETPGQTGVSHVVEHMLFKGTPRFPAGTLDEATRAVGGDNNAGTNTDYTVYYETVPSGDIDRFLDMEADRMVNATISDADFDSEIKVVREERRMRSEDDPMGLFWEEIYAAAFKASPYHWPVIGWMSDLMSLTAPDLRAYYKLHYEPNNATLVLVGDFDTAALMGRVRDIFGKIPRGPDAPAVRSVEPPQQVNRRITFRSAKTNLAHVVYSYHVPEVAAPDSPALDTIAAVLSSGRDSRLEKAFVETGLASSVNAYFDSSRDACLFSFDIEVMPGVDTAAIEKELRKQIEALKTDLVTDYELQRAKNRFLASEIFENQTVRTYGMKIGWFETAGGDYKLLDRYLDRTQTLTAEELREVGRRYFIDTNLTSGELLPDPSATGEAAGGAPGSMNRTAHYRDADTFRKKKQPTAAAATPANVSKTAIAPRVKKIVLPNGLTLIILENHAFPTVYFHGVVRGAGAAADPKNKEGVATLAASSVRRGTATRSYDDINKQLEFTGSDISFGAGVETMVFRAHFLSKDLKTGVDILSDVLLRPAFPADGVARERDIQLANIDDTEKNTRSQAWNLFGKLVFGVHPYSHVPLGPRGAVERLTRDDVAAFYKANWRPDRTILAIVGDVDANALAAEISRALGTWKRPDNKPYAIQAPAPLKQSLKQSVTMPEKTQSVLYLGFPTIARSDPDYDAFRLMTNILAAPDLTSRLYGIIREKEGLVYYVSGSDAPRTQANTFQIAAGVSPQNVQRVVDLALAEIQRIRTERVSDQDLARAKSFAIGHQALELETSSALADRLANLEYFGRPFTDLDTWALRLQKITPDDIMRVAARHLHPEAFALAVAGPQPSGRSSNPPK